jgi:hypothetical protein
MPAFKEIENKVGLPSFVFATPIGKVKAAYDCRTDSPLFELTRTRARSMEDKKYTTTDSHGRFFCTVVT